MVINGFKRQTKPAERRRATTKTLQNPRGTGSFSQLMEEAEDEGSSFWLDLFSRFAGVSWDEAETNRGNAKTTDKRRRWDESADGRARRKGVV